LSGDVIVWELIRASGLLAYALLSAAVMLGVAVRVRALDWAMRRAWVFEFHQVLSVLALAFTGLHMLLLAVNSHVPFGVTAILVPFASEWRPLGAALGTLSFYLIGLLIVSSYMRGRIGQRAWRAIHFGGFAGWVMALAHGVAAGSDTGAPWVQYMYLATAGVVLFLTLFRIIEEPARPPARAKAAEAKTVEGGVRRSPVAPS
jgi:predicted ferric reductase